jgi:nitrogenase-associated protein
MAYITFYEKPGCSGNRRQKEWLLLSGHTLEVFDLIDHAWTKDELSPFLAGKPVKECFNPAAPEIRDARLDPSGISCEEAIDLMVRNPLLIKRPLMVIDGRHLQGFDTALLRTIISLEPVAGAEKLVEKFRMLDMNSCAYSSNDTCTIKED